MLRETASDDLLQTAGPLLRRKQVYCNAKIIACPM